MEAGQSHSGALALSLRERLVREVSRLTETYHLPQYFPGEVFLNAPEEIRRRIHLMLGDSRSLDFSHLYGKAGLVLVDGGKMYDVFLSDTEQALKLVKPGGVVVWDDYNRFWPTVISCINNLSKHRKLYYLRQKVCSTHRLLVVSRQTSVRTF